MITVIFYRIVDSKKVAVRSESCYNEIELDELIENDSHLYDSYEVLNKV